MEYIFIVLKSNKGNISEKEVENLLSGLSKANLSLEKITILNADKF